MRNKYYLITITFIAILIPTLAYSEGRLVFQSFPSKRNGKTLETKEVAKHQIIIKKIDDQYIWASRGNRKLVHRVSGIYHIFLERNGSGMISIMDASILSESIRGDEPLLQYGEHIRNGTSMISYQGYGYYLKL